VSDNLLNQTRRQQQVLLPVLSLFTSLGTLVCCALPALLVTLGLGATLAGLVSNAPWLIILSEHKVLIFMTSAVMLLASFMLQYRARNLPCPVDPEKAKACQRLRRLSWVLLSISITIYFIGFFFAFIAVHVFY